MTSNEIIHVPLSKEEFKTVRGYFNRKRGGFPEIPCTGEMGLKSTIHNESIKYKIFESKHFMAIGENLDCTRFLFKNLIFYHDFEDSNGSIRIDFEELDDSEWFIDEDGTVNVTTEYEWTECDSSSFYSPYVECSVNLHFIFVEENPTEVSE